MSGQVNPRWLNETAMCTKPEFGGPPRRYFYREDLFYTVQCRQCKRTLKVVGAALNSTPIRCPCQPKMGSTRWRLLPPEAHNSEVTGK